MLANLPPPLLALLHEGGWDEMIMVAVGLIVAYAVITWTGRRSRDDDDEDEDEEDGEGLSDDVTPSVSAESVGERPSPRSDEPPRTAS